MEIYLKKNLSLLIGIFNVLKIKIKHFWNLKAASFETRMTETKFLHTISARELKKKINKPEIVWIVEGVN